MGKHDNIFLVGLMGAGKTTIGKSLARQLEKTFYDSDYVLEQRTGVRIPVIFEIEGEAGFRKREEEALEGLTCRDNIVLATGGGAVLAASNREKLKARGTVVYLHGRPEDLCQRTRHDKNRPLLQTENRMQKLKDLYQVRDPLYREVADIVVDTGRQSIQSLTEKLKRQLVDLGYAGKGETSPEQI
ncbi:MAG: shikimate kinase [Thiobacillaceae bacterium]|jgi:shikimate kinase